MAKSDEFKAGHKDGYNSSIGGDIAKDAVETVVEILSGGLIKHDDDYKAGRDQGREDRDNK